LCRTDETLKLVEGFACVFAGIWKIDCGHGLSFGLGSSDAVVELAAASGLICGCGGL
jgi:hypothetical protein